MAIWKKSQQGKSFKEQIMTEALIAAVKKDTGGKPFRLLYTLKKMSMKARYI